MLPIPPFPLEQQPVEPIASNQGDTEGHMKAQEKTEDHFNGLPEGGSPRMSDSRQAVDSEDGPEVTTALHIADLIQAGGEAPDIAPMVSTLIVVLS